MSVGNDREMGTGEASWSCSHMLMLGHAHTAPDPCPQSHGPEVEWRVARLLKIKEGRRGKGWWANRLSWCSYWCLEAENSV